MIPEQLDLSVTRSVSAAAMVPLRDGMYQGPSRTDAADSGLILATQSPLSASLTTHTAMETV